jgi:hypothetical protein
MAIITDVTAAVTVTSIDSCATAGCPSEAIPFPTLGVVAAGPTIDGLATRYALTAADARTWTLYLRNDAMPVDFIKVDDAFDMTIQANVNTTFYSTLNQTVVLAHGSSLQVFASDQNTFVIPPLPNLAAFGVMVTDSGAICQETNSLPGSCLHRPHAATVSNGTDSASVASGMTARIGWLSFTNALFLELKDTGGCDGKGQTLTAGFRAP